jgi:hypothetical protein
MGFTYLMAMICAAIAPESLRSVAERARRIVPTGFLWSCTYVAVLEVLLLLQLALMEKRQVGAYAPLPQLSPDDLANVCGAIAVLQTLGLAALYVSLRSGDERRRDVAIVAGGAVVMFACGLCYLNTRGDVLAYVGSGLLVHPYAPEHVRFSGEFAVINHAWRYPLLPSPYGPLWEALAHLVVVPFHTLRGAILAFQLLEVFALLAMIAMLRRRGVRLATIAVLALNPFIVQAYVAEGHNDLIATALVFAACFLSAPASVVAVVAAGGVKASLAALGLCAFARFDSARTRWTCAASALAGSAGLVLLAGPDYVRAVRATTQAYWQPISPTVQAFHVACAALAVAFLVAGLFGKRLPAGGAWCGIALASVSGALALFLITLPYAGFEVSNVFVLALTPFGNVLRFDVAIALALAVYLTIRRAAFERHKRRSMTSS